MQKTTEQLIRDSLAQFPRPAPTSQLTDDIVRRAQVYESVRHKGAGRLTQAILMTYWLAAAALSVWILMRLPLPAWNLSSLNDTLSWLIPLVGVMLLRFGSLVTAVVASCERRFRPFRDLILDDIQGRST